MPTAKPTAAAVKREVAALADPVRALTLQRFFRSGPGDYGEGDRFLGLTVPDERQVVRAFPTLPLPEITKLLRSPFHEHRLIALLILAHQHERADAPGQLELHRFTLDHIAAINNWDLVDSCAATLVGTHIPTQPKLLDTLAASPNLWARRIAIVSTFAELRANRTAATFRIAERLLDDRHDLIHKATGWLLREAGKRSLPDLLHFLRTHYVRLPRTTLRYAIERLDPLDRKQWLAGPQ
jgi:3-methyladenine DNA glycosylase AlkD